MYGDKYNIIIASIMTNIQVEARCVDGQVILKDLNLKDPAHRLYLQVASLYAGVEGIPCYLDVPFPTYVRFILRHFKNRHSYRHISKSDIPKRVVPTNEITEYVRKSFRMDRAEFALINSRVYGDKI